MRSRLPFGHAANAGDGGNDQDRGRADHEKGGPDPQGKQSRHSNGGEDQQERGKNAAGKSAFPVQTRGEIRARGSAHRAGLGGHIPGFPSLPVLWTASPVLHSAQFSWPGVHSSLTSLRGFLPACFEITTSLGCCTWGPRREVKGEEEGAGLPTLKLGTRG